jgi:hypothetical protein
MNAQMDSIHDAMQKWTGTWQGNLAWQESKDSVSTVRMRLIIQPLDSADWYTWNLVYGDSETDNRGYTLKPVDWRTGHWQVDEHNGIVIDQYLFGNSFVSSFDVLGTHIVDEFESDNDEMTVRFFSFSTQPECITGEGTETSPRVQSFPLQSRQKVVLHRID